MKTIWKYVLAYQDRQEIIMPKNAKILYIDEQDNQICIWAEVETENTIECRFFYIFRTGHRFTYFETELKLKYIGSVKIENGRLVYHVYEEIV